MTGESRDEPSAAASTPSPVPGYHVGGAGCDDAHTAADAMSAGTAWCTLSHATLIAPPNATILIAPGAYEALAADGVSAQQGLHFEPLNPKQRPVLHGATLKYIHGYQFTNLSFDASLAINKSTGIVVRGNRFTGAGVYVRQSQDVAITKNSIAHLKGIVRGILLQSTYAAGAPTNENIEIRGNRIADTQLDAIAVYNGYRNITIAGNRIQDVRQPAGFAYHSDGLQLMGGDGATVEGNVIGHVTHGIIVKDGPPTTHLTIKRNLVYGVDGAALQLYNTPGANLKQNTFWSARFGVILDNDRNVSGFTSTRLAGNVLIDLSARSPGAVSSATGNVFGRGKRVGRPAYRGRPRFVNARGGDYRIRSARPGAGIHRGSTVPGAQLRGRP